MIRSIKVYAVMAVLTALVLLLGACGGGNAEPTATPTAVPTVAEPTATPVPPTETPVPEAAPAEATEEESAAEEAAPAESAETEEATAAEATETEAPAEEAAAAAVTETEAPAEEAAAAEATETEGAAASEAAETEAPAEETATAEATATEAPAEEAAASGGVVIVESGRRVTDVVNESDVPFAAISPDGSFIAWFAQTGRRSDRTGQICVFTFANADKTCHDIPVGEFRDWPYQLQWSPDSTMIAFTENPVQLGNDSDIWIFTVADGSFQDLTNDGVTGSWRGQADALIDYLPAWNTADGSIVFWRVVPQGNMQFDIGLYKVTPGSEAEQIRDLTQDLGQQLPLFDQEVFYMDGFSAVSPDGTKLAAIVSGFDQFGALQPSLWMIDLVDTAAAPVQLMTNADYQSAIPTWPGIPAAPVGLSWTADGAIVTVGFSNMGNSTPFMVFYYVDPAAGTFTPVVDFSGIEDSSAYFATAPGSNLPWRAYSPWTGSVSPAGDQLLMVNDLTGSMGLFTANLPPTGELPAVGTAVNESIASTVTRSSRAETGKMLIYGLLLTVGTE